MSGEEEKKDNCFDIDQYAIARVLDQQRRVQREEEETRAPSVLSQVSIGQPKLKLRTVPSKYVKQITTLYVSLSPVVPL